MEKRNQSPESLGQEEMWDCISIENILRIISASTGKGEKIAFRSGRRCWAPCSQSLGLVAAFPVASKCSFVSSADVLHSRSHDSQRTISECEGGVRKKKKKQRYSHRRFPASLPDSTQTNIPSVLSAWTPEPGAADWCR